MPTSDPILKSVTVPLGPEQAFDLFARRMDSWWPGDKHSASARTSALPRQITIEPYKGGTISELTADGKVVIWGRILAWDPGRYLAFTWTPDRKDDDDAETVVAISFTPTPDGTRLDLTQGAPQTVLGDLADAVSTTRLRGWQLVLGCYHSRASATACVAV